MAAFPANASAPIATTGRPLISAGISTAPDGANSGAPRTIDSSQIAASHTTLPMVTPHRAESVWSSVSCMIVAASTTAPFNRQSRNMQPSHIGVGSSP